LASAVGAAISLAVKGLGAVFGGTALGGGIAGALAQITAFTALNAGLNRLQRQDFDNDPGLGSRDVSSRSASANASIIYGETLVGGVLRFSGTSGNENEFLWRSEILAGHECDDITDVYIDTARIRNSEINWDTDGQVNAGDFSGSAWFYKQLGTSSQTVTADLESAFPLITTAHAAKGRCLLEARFLWNEANNSLWDQTGAPVNLKGLVKGKNDIYDPRNDSSPGANVDSNTYRGWSDNPILCLANYLTDTRLGMGMSNDRIDWQFVANEADYCDGQVPLHNAGSEKRFTCNGVLATGNSHRDNIQILLSACDGRMSFRGDKWILRAGRLGEGSNLCTNGEFESDLSGWTAAPASSGTIERDTFSGFLKLTNGASGFQTARYALSVTEGTTYTARVVVKESGNPSNRYGLTASYNANGQTDPLARVTKTTENSELRITFKATETGTLYICPYIDSSTTGLDAEFSHVEIYKVTDVNIDGDWMSGDVTVSGSPPKELRYNRVDALYVSPTQNYKATEALPVSNADYLARDNGELLTHELTLQMTDSELGSQRLAFKYLNKSDKPKSFQLPCNYKALKLAPHDYVSFSLPELGLVDQLMRIQSYRLNDLGSAQGVELVCTEDDADTYADPDISDYSLRTAAGIIVPAIDVVPEPTGFTVDSKQGGNLLSWANPTIPQLWDTIEVYASTTNLRSNATRIHRTRSDEYLHKLDAGETFYYWIRAVRADQVTDYLPNTETSTVTATAGNDLATAATTANWSGVVDDDPDNNPRPQAGASGSFYEKPDWYDGTFWIQRDTEDILQAENSNTLISDPDGNSIVDPDGTPFSATGTFVKVGSLDVTRLNNANLVLNEAISILSNGQLSGGGGGQVTIVGLGYNGSLDATDNTITSSTGTPDNSVGVDGNLHYNTTSEAWIAKIGGFWVAVSDRTASNIAAGITGQGDLAVLDSADWATQISGSNKPEDNATNGATWGSNIDGANLPEDNATQNVVTRSTAVPSGGSSGDLHQRTNTGKWYANIAGTWYEVADATALNIAIGITGQGDLATLDDVDWSTHVTGSGKPQDNATRNEGPLLSDGFSISSNITADALPISNWSLDRDGSTPITLVSGSSFEFDEAGAYQVNLTLSMSFDVATSSSSIPPSIEFQLYTRYAADGSTYAAADNYQYIQRIRPYSTTSTTVTGFDSIALSIVVDAAANSRMRFYFNAVNAGTFAVNNCKVDILQLKQVPN
jgi:hypothetical protein